MKQILFMRTIFVNILLFVSASCLAQNIVAEGEYAYRLDSIVRVESYGTIVERFRYDEQGRIVENIQTFPSEQKPRKSIYHYDERGFCVGEDEYEVEDGKNILVMVTQVTYTDEGRLLKRESNMYQKGEKLWRKNTDSYTYDKRGKLVEVVSEYDYMNNTSTSKTKTTYAYNSRNQMTEEVLYGYKYNENEFFPNITYKMEYDKKGRLIHSTTIQTTGIVGDGTSECFFEYTEQNGQVVREQRKLKYSLDDNWKVDVDNRSYDTYGNLIREDHEEGNLYKGSTNYYFDVTTKAENVMGYGQGSKPGMELLNNTPSYKYRIMRINTTNANGDFEALGNDRRYYYSEIKK